ncbi:ABC transporter permease [Dinghuibacter silviterrae]|uniref:Putative ABC transport system permease protein n=1 Tax=Dinghuibacter silviterrae TaxID=1539049 RepID=A0A4V3GM17_9BACT|nr:ABC transporter permease [Dinghuibacter silviterrae]TDX01633.1 putative ABC transport system permease protein [Dinghuibacter silviterrae]
MLFSYIRIVIRNLRRQPLLSFIHIFGLGLSMSAGLMVLIRLQDDLGYDRFHPHPERTYRITSDYTQRGGEHWRMASTPLPLGPALLSDTAGIEAVATINPSFGGTTTIGSKQLSLSGAYTGPSFFAVFGFTLSSGDPVTALAQPHSIVLSQDAATRFFGQANPLGKVLTMTAGGSYIVTGVLKDPPGKSHLDFDAYVSETSIPPHAGDWFAFNAAYTYVVMKRPAETAALYADLATVSTMLNRMNAEGKTAFHWQRITAITPAPIGLDNNIGRGTSWAKVFFELGFAFLLLLAACFNYTNLTVARALTRAKEVGLRKIAGAHRHQVFVQYVTEAVVTALLALGFAWILLGFIITYAPFNDGYEFIPSSFAYNAQMGWWSLAFALGTGLLAGVSPAWILSAFKPLRVLKNLSTARIWGKVNLQKTLIVFQYTLSLVILIFLTAFYRQFSYMSSLDPGFRRDNTLVIPVDGPDASVLAQKIASLSGVQTVAALSGRFDDRSAERTFTGWLAGKEQTVNLHYYDADPAFLPAMHLDLVAGHNFLSEDTVEKFVLLNEKAVRALGFADPSKAVGQRLWVADSTPLIIQGVLKDFTYQNAAQPIAPLALRTRKGSYNYLYVRVDPVRRDAITARIAAAWGALLPAKSFSYTWLDEYMEAAYAQKATLSLLGYLAFMAASIATLGLLGLVMYTVEVRRKEISIRKVIGAEKRELVVLLSRGFVRLLVLSGLIAMPLGYTAGVFFRHLFPLQAPFGPGYAVACFFLLLVLGLATIGSQTYRAAGENPAGNLRAE